MSEMDVLDLDAPEEELLDALPAAAAPIPAEALLDPVPEPDPEEDLGVARWAKPEDVPY